MLTLLNGAKPKKLKSRSMISNPDSRSKLRSRSQPVYKRKFKSKVESWKWSRSKLKSRLNAGSRLFIINCKINVKVMGIKLRITKNMTNLSSKLSIVAILNNKMSQKPVHLSTKAIYVYDNLENLIVIKNLCQAKSFHYMPIRVILKKSKFLASNLNIIRHYIKYQWCHTSINIMLYVQMVAGKEDADKEARWITAVVSNLPDLNTYPPNAPAAFGSKLYPAEPVLNSAEGSVPIQLWSVNTARKEKEVLMIGAAKSSNFLEIRNRYKSVASIRPYCSLCSELKLDCENLRPSVIKYHQHISSLQYRINTPLDRFGQYCCPQCELNPHYFKCGVRYPILVTSSTLSQWQGRNWRARAANAYKGDQIHVDQISLPGGRIRDLRSALRAEYSESELPLDILIAGGLNDLNCNSSADTIIQELANWKQEIETWNPDSTVAICTLPYPPSLTFLSRDYHRHQEAVRHTDKTAVINQLNPAITRLNQSGPQGNITSRAPRMTTWGLRQALVQLNNNNPADRSVGNLTAHRTGQWRERESTRQLHLDDRTRFRFGKATVAYFRRMYGLPSAPDRTPDSEPLPESPPEPIENHSNITSPENIQILTDWKPVESSEDDTDSEHGEEIETVPPLLELQVKEKKTDDIGQWKIGPVNWDDEDLSDISEDELLDPQSQPPCKKSRDHENAGSALNELLERVPMLYDIRSIILDLVNRAVEIGEEGAIVDGPLADALLDVEDSSSDPELGQYSPMEPDYEI